MQNVAVLYCEEKNQRVKLELKNRGSSFTDLDFSECITVFEDGWYEIAFSYYNNNLLEITAIIVHVNGDEIGYVDLEVEDNTVGGTVVFYKNSLDSKQRKSQPFLLLYDLAILSFEIIFEDGSVEDVCSDYLLCISKREDDVDNISSMLEYLSEFNDETVMDWVFLYGPQKEKIGLHEGNWKKHAFKTLPSYMQLIKEIIVCYTKNLVLFKSVAKRTVREESRLTDYNKVDKVTFQSFNWLVQNLNQMFKTDNRRGISVFGDNYLPNKIMTSVKIQSLDVYENKVVVSFLHTVLEQAKSLYNDFNDIVRKETKILEKIQGNLTGGYVAPIFTIKTIQIKYSKSLLEKLSFLVKKMQMLERNYYELFNLCGSIFTSLPRKTKTFQEIKPYIQVYEMIIRWYCYGEVCLDKERLILQVRTLDKLFEYYCLFEILSLFAQHGFIVSAKDNSISRFCYSGNRVQEQENIPNTYILEKGKISVTVYYQPVIRSERLENDLDLYRTTENRISEYYIPDFVVKFTLDGRNDEYIILDSKFSSRNNIKKYYLNNVLQKYSCDIGVAGQFHAAPKMVWILQGRVNKLEKPIWYYHNSVLAQKYQPRTSYGIVSINRLQDASGLFWSEIKRNISFLD